MSLIVLSCGAVVAVVLALGASGGQRSRALGGRLTPRTRSAARTVTSWRVAGTVVGLAAATRSLQGTRWAAV